jgi:hypothetical protein
VGPSGNCFVVGAPGAFRLEVVQSAVRSMTLLAIVNDSYDKETVYDRFGMKWCLAETRSRWKKSWLGPLLARTVYNPLVEVQVSWRKPEPYRLEELKASYLSAVERSAEVLPRSVDVTRVKTRIAEAQNFDDLVEVHRWIGTQAR